MPSLREIQSAFAAGVFERGDERIVPHIKEARFPAERYLQIHRNNVFASLTGALQSIYPVVTRVVGEGFLKYAADDFIRRQPPTSGNLHDFGRGFPEFLGRFPPARKLAYLPDVARLEWAYHEAFHAADAEPLDPRLLASIRPEHYGQLRFALHPSARLLASPYPVLRIWLVNQPGYVGEETVDLAEGGVSVLVIRRDAAVELQTLSEGDFTLLGALSAGHAFARACALALAAEPEFDLSDALRRHVLTAAIVGFG